VGVNIPELSIAIAANDVQFFLSGFNDFAVLPVRSGRAVFMIYWEGSMTVSTPGLSPAVNARGPFILVDSSAAGAATGVSSVFCRVTETLTAWVVARDG